MNPEPLLLAPSGKDYLWGGNRLKSEYGKNLFLDPLAESWECSVHPDGPSRIDSGSLKGRLLSDVLDNFEFGMHWWCHHGIDSQQNAFEI